MYLRVTLSRDIRSELDWNHIGIVIIKIYARGVSVESYCLTVGMFIMVVWCSSLSRCSQSGWWDTFYTNRYPWMSIRC